MTLAKYLGPHWKKLLNAAPYVLLVGALATFIAGVAIDYVRVHESQNSVKVTHATSMQEVYDRIFENINLTGDAIERGMRGANWMTWTHKELNDAYLRKTPYIRAVLLFDTEGNQLVTTFPTFARINVSDRPYFQANRTGQKYSWFGPYEGRNSGTFTFMLSRRVEDSTNTFIGVMGITGEHRELDRICSVMLPAQHMRVALITTDRDMIVSYCDSEGRNYVGLPTKPVMPLDTHWVDLRAQDGLRVGVAIDAENEKARWFSGFLSQFFFFCSSFVMVLVALMFLVVQHTRHKAREIHHV